MKEFDHILNWKLLCGSHRFPGPDGGTCINEAAIVAAGFDYIEVTGIKSLPSCFCPVLGSFLIHINDHADGKNRQKLMKYVTKLSGSLDQGDFLYKRIELISIRYSKLIIDTFNEVTKNCYIKDPRTKTLGGISWEELYWRTNKLTNITNGVRLGNDGYFLKVSDELKGDRFSFFIQQHIMITKFLDLYTKRTLHEDLFMSLINFDDILEIIDDAFAIGNQADPIDIGLVQSRMEKIRQKELT